MAMSNRDDYLLSLGGPDLVAWHRNNGVHRSADEYLGLQRDLLVRGLRNTRLLYLDTNYWVRLRDAAIGRGSPEALKLLQTLRALVRSREALCVSQLHSLLELGRQTGDSLRASADLLDELTEGVLLAAPHDLLLSECAEFVRAKVRREVGLNLSPWTRVGLMHRSALPDKLPGPATAAQKSVVFKAAIDSLWNASFNYLFAEFDWDTKSRLSFELDSEIFAKISQRKVEQLARGLTRGQLRKGEFTTLVADQLKPIFIALLLEWHRERGFPEGIAALVRDVHITEITAVANFAERTLGSLLPGVAIQTELYVLKETNASRTKPLTTNDWVDWSLAAVALPYCDVFFTERSLAHRLRQELKADVQYDCEVIGSIGDALAHFKVQS